MGPLESLDEARIGAGERLVLRLESQGNVVPAALWSYASEVNEWRLYVVMPALRQQGPSAGPEQVSLAIAALKTEEDFPLARQDIWPVAADHPVIAQLAAGLGTGPTLSRLRIQGMRVNGQIIEHALIYRLHKAGLAR